MADKISPERRSWNMSRIRGKDTLPEKRFRSLLHRAGFRFRLHSRKLPGRPDIVLPKYRTVVFVHGCYWHRHKGCRFATTPKTRKDFWLRKFKKNVARDKEVQAILKKENWRVFVVWECELDKNPEKLIDKFQRFVKVKAGIHG